MNEKIKYGLLESDLNDVISILAENNKVRKLVLFGSRAKGSYTTGSDIDIAIKGDDLELNDILDALTEIENLNLPYKFDFVIHDRIKEKALLDHIDRVGIVLFEKTA